MLVRALTVGWQIGTGIYESVPWIIGKASSLLEKVEVTAKGIELNADSATPAGCELTPCFFWPEPT
jgi:hypothetical protein